MANDPDDEHIYTDVDRFHAGQDKINFASEDSDSDKSVRTKGISASRKRLLCGEQITSPDVRVSDGVRFPIIF